MEELEKRLRALEQQLALWKGAFLVASVAILAWIGITAWVSLPQEVNKQLADKIGSETLARVKQFNDQLAAIDSNAEATAKKLGITELKAELQSLEKELRVPSDDNDTTEPKITPDGNTQTKHCPPGTYMVGIKFQIDSGGPHGQTSHLYPIYRRFLPSSDAKQP